MTLPFQRLGSGLLTVFAAVCVSAQEEAAPAGTVDEPETEAASPAPAPEEKAPDKEEKTGPKGFNATWETKKGARILNLSIPAPRGQIVDRNGMPMAQNRVTHYLGVNFPTMDGASDSELVGYVRERLDYANHLLGKDWSLDSERILAHYKDRRWLPLIFSSVLSEAEVEKLRRDKMDGLILHPTYQRVYPLGKVASHIIGFVGERGPWAIGEIPNGEALWPTARGVQGLESSFDEELTGVPGEVQIIFNEQGERVEETLIRAPVPGHNVVTTLDLTMQKMTERILSEQAKRGAFVIMDVQNGDILAMASWPDYDPNDFVPRITFEKFQALQDDPDNPLYARAFQGVYPPASTFKIAAALAMLEVGSVNASTVYNCPRSFYIGDRQFHNWNKSPEGYMNVIGAITRSCNTWFYQAAIDTGAPHITTMARRLGLGEKTGIPLNEEVAGFMPTNEWYRENLGYPILDGDLANIVIGQGKVLSTPLQVAQMMAAVGNRQYLHEARLVLQIQDYANGIVRAFDVNRESLNISQYALSVVHQGMEDVVNAGNGTARRARHEEITVSGKTGTGQWKPTKEQNVAWFAGFAPAEAPVYAYAALYEGEPGEDVGGGRNAGPILGSFFEEYLKDEQRLAALKATSEEIRLAMESSIDIPTIETGPIFRDRLADSRWERPQEQQPEPEKKKKGLFQLLFGN